MNSNDGSLFCAIERQERLLGGKLSGEIPLTSAELIKSYLGMRGYDVSTNAIALKQLGILCRIIDNLIDEECLSKTQVLTGMFDGKIEPYLRLLGELDIAKQPSFIVHSKRAVQILSKYEDSRSLKMRIIEARILARLYALVLDGTCTKEGYQKIEKDIAPFFIASYMFCDLKDFFIDERRPDEFLRIIGLLVYNSTLLARQGLNIHKLMQSVGRTVFESLRLMKGKHRK